MEPKLLIVNAVTLLYLESLIESKSENSADLAREVVATIKLPEHTLDTNRGRETLIALRSTLLWMADQPNEHSYNKAELHQRIRLSCNDDDFIYNAFLDVFAKDYSQEELKNTCLSFRETMRGFLGRKLLKDTIKKAYTDTHFNEDQVDWKNIAKNLAEELDGMAGAAGDTKIPGLVDMVNFSDPKEVAKLMTRAQDDSSTEGALITGNQDLNDMFGEAGGFRRGEFVVVGALQHNYKTGFTLNVFKQWAIYNDPVLSANSRKPMLVHLSFENSLTDNIMQLYISLKENETGALCDISTVDVDQASVYVIEKLQARGWHVHMARIDPTEFTIHDLKDYIMRLESQGYEIHGMVVDYLNMISKRGCTITHAGGEIRDLFRRMRNFTSPRKITFITPHQLSTESKNLLRQGVDDFVKEVANKGYWDSCKTIDQEVDMELYIHIVKVNGESYLTVQRGKHRKPKPTAESKLYVVMKFEQIAGIPDDIGKERIGRRHPGGKLITEGGGRAWHDIPQAA